MSKLAEPKRTAPSSIRTTGFTLVEILVVVVIVALLAALLSGVYGRVKESARQANCVSNLKQIGAAVLLYRTDYDGEGRYGDPYMMGLPTSQRPLSPSLLPWSIWRCPNEWHFDARVVPSKASYYTFIPSAPDTIPWKRFVDAASRFQDRTPLYFDPYHNERAGFFSPLTSKLGLAVTLSGATVRVFKKGDFTLIDWWIDEQGN
ncbi:MAG: hypothetical protein DCC46_12690 [Armatimonadetes bacterium]|nr:MAG: hypothetical protein DCC46_12690 [Armatimonadota bacterium]